MLSIEIMQHPTYRLFVAVLRVLYSKGWREQYPEAAAAMLPAWDRLFPLVRPQGKMISSDPAADLILVLATSLQDERLQGLWSVEEVAWLVGEMASRQQAKLLVALLGVHIQRPHDDDLWTAEECATNTGHLSPVRWRDLSAQGRVFGAIKRGGTWFIPAVIAQAIARRDA